MIFLPAKIHYFFLLKIIKIFYLLKRARNGLLYSSILICYNVWIIYILRKKAHKKMIGKISFYNLFVAIMFICLTKAPCPQSRYITISGDTEL